MFGTNSTRRRAKKSDGSGASVFRRLVTMLAGLAVIAGSFGIFATPAQATGNNGTIKIHEEGTPVGTEDNDPKVCSFNIESYNLDAGQDGYIVFDVQGGDGPVGTPAGPFDFGPADENGFFATEYYSLDNGHYKATLYGKFGDGGINYDDVKAKSKVFKVECPPAQPDDKVEYGEWVDGNKDCESKTVTQTRTKSVTTYEWDGTKWVAQTPVVTTETRTRPMTEAELKECESPVTPVAPTEPTSSDVCEPASGPTNDRITIPSDANFSYQLDGKDVAAGQVVATGTSHTVTAVAKEGVVVKEGAKTSWPFAFTKVLCETPVTPPPPPPVPPTDVCPNMPGTQPPGTVCTTPVPPTPTPEPEPKKVKPAVKKLDKCELNNFLWIKKHKGYKAFDAKTGKRLPEGRYFKVGKKVIKVKFVALKGYELSGKKKIKVVFPNMQSCSPDVVTPPPTGMRLTAS